MLGLIAVTGSALAIGTSSGASPQTQTNTVAVTIPTRVGIYLERIVAINLAPPPIPAITRRPVRRRFPGYYVDQSAPRRPPSSAYSATSRPGICRFSAAPPVFMPVARR